MREQIDGARTNSTKRNNWIAWMVDPSWGDRFCSMVTKLEHKQEVTKKESYETRTMHINVAII